MFTTVENLKKAAIELFNSDRAGAEDALAVALNILEGRMSECEFVAFCEGMQ